MLKGLKTKAVGGVLLLLPFFVFPMNGDPNAYNRIPKMMAAYMLGNLCFAFLLGEVSFFLGLAHLAFSWIVMFSGFGSWQIYPQAFEAAGMMLALWFVRLDERERLGILRLVAIGGILCCFQAYLQTMGFTWPLTFAPGIETWHPIAFLGQHTLFGAYAAPIAALCLALNWYPAALFCALMALLTGSSFTALSLGAGLLVVARHKIGLKPTLALVGAGGIALLGLFLLHPRLDAFAGNGRLGIWGDLVRCASARPWFGFGPGGFNAIFASSCQKHSLDAGHFFEAHNDLLQVLFDGGRVGLAALAIVLFGILRAYFHSWWRRESFAGGILLRNYDRVSLVASQGMLAAMLFNCLGNFPWQLSPHYLIGLISAAILLQAAPGAGTIFPCGRTFKNAPALIARRLRSWLMGQSA